MSSELLSVTTTIHVGLLPVTLVGLYRYTDRYSLFTKSVGHPEDLHEKLRGAIAEALESALMPVFERANAEPRIVTTTSYTERAMNPVGSEAYKAAVRGFIDSRVGFIVVYGRCLRARECWSFWARLVSWIVLGLAIWETLCSACFGLAGRLFDVTISDTLAGLSFAPTTVLVTAFFFANILMLRHHDAIDRIRITHDGV